MRLALKWALDRDQIQKKVFLGHAKVGNDNPIAPSVKFSIDPQPKYHYDPEKAKFYLKKAGLSSLKVDLSAAEAGFNGAVDDFDHTVPTDVAQAATIMAINAWQFADMRDLLTRSPKP